MILIEHRNTCLTNCFTANLFSAKKSTRRSSLEMSRDNNFPMMPWGPHVTQFVTSLETWLGFFFIDRFFLSVLLSQLQWIQIYPPMHYYCTGWYKLMNVFKNTVKKLEIYTINCLLFLKSGNVPALSSFLLSEKKS